MDEAQTPEQSDAELVCAVLEGETDAFAELVARYKNVVTTYVAARVPGPEVEDLAQEVFVRSFRVLDTLREPKAFGAWLLGIAHHVVKLQDSFERLVVGPFITEYLKGRTPIPCAVCNRVIKFGELFRLASEAGAERIATGHYARIRRDPATGRYQLLRGVDPAKDQSYFLFGMSQQQLARVLFPLGSYTKEQVREKARELGLPVAGKGESQEICFIPNGDYAAFIDAYYATSDDGGDSWTEFRLTPSSFDSAVTGPGGGQFIGDYLGLGIGENCIYPVYPSTQNGINQIFSHEIVSAGAALFTDGFESGTADAWSFATP